MAEQQVRLVVLGGAAAAPVCEGDVCYVPASTATAQSAEVPAAEDETRDHDETGETQRDPRVA